VGECQAYDAGADDDDGLLGRRCAHCCSCHLPILVRRKLSSLSMPHVSYPRVILVQLEWILASGNTQDRQRISLSLPSLHPPVLESTLRCGATATCLLDRQLQVLIVSHWPAVGLTLEGPRMRCAPQAEQPPSEWWCRRCARYYEYYPISRPHDVPDVNFGVRLESVCAAQQLESSKGCRIGAIQVLSDRPTC
jgi:hypothetical protein